MLAVNYCTVSALMQKKEKPWHKLIGQVSAHPSLCQLENENFSHSIVTFYSFCTNGYHQLAEDLQESLCTYVEEDCGVDSDVAAFISMYADYQEQVGYLGWLKAVRSILQKERKVCILASRLRGGWSVRALVCILRVVVLYYERSTLSKLKYQISTRGVQVV